MASDYTPTNVTSGFEMEVSINQNFNEIKTAMDKLLNRELPTDNALEIPLDFNGQQAINLPTPVLPTEPLRLQDLASLVNEGSAGVASLYVLSGVPVGDTELGTFTKSIIQDNTTVKIMGQDLESAVYDSGIGFNSFTAMKSNALSQIDAEGQHFNTGGTIWEAITGTTTVTIANTSPQLFAHPLTRLNMKDFGADSSGVTSVSVPFQAAVDLGFPIVFPKGTYVYDVSTQSLLDQDIDFNGSTFTRMSATAGGFFGQDAGSLKMVNGSVDNQNLTVNFGHLIRFNSLGKSIHLDGLTLRNNVLGGFTNPTKSIDTDLINIQDCSSCVVKNCTIDWASRQGISLTNPTPFVEITNNDISNCYLFGIDIEPNTSTTFMYETVNIISNRIVDCGRKDDVDNWVWNSGGPIGVASGVTNIAIVKDLIFSDNVIESNEFLAIVGGGVVPPFMKFEQCRNVDFHGNTIKNIERLLFATSDPNCPINRVTLTGNAFNPFSGSIETIIFSFNALKLQINSNPELRGVVFSSTGGQVQLNDNTVFSAVTGFKAQDSRPALQSISGNTFRDCTTCIDVSSLSENYIISSNISTGDTTFLTGAVTNSLVADNKHDGVNINGFTVSVSRSSGIDVRVDASSNGYQERHKDLRTTSNINDEYYDLEIESADTNNAGIVGSFKCIKDLSNANAYGAWELWGGIGNGNTNFLYSAFNGHLLPSRDAGQDNLQNLGSATIRWKTIFAGTGSIDTSDATLKQQIKPLTLKEKLVSSKLKGLIKSFKFNDAVEEKGSEAARIHFGVIAQEVQEAFLEEGLDPKGYALFCEDTVRTLDGKVYYLQEGVEVPEEVEVSTRLGIRYSELICFIISTM